MSLAADTTGGTPPRVKMSSHAALEKKAMATKKAFCESEGYCLPCFLEDSEILIPLKGGLCLYCDSEELAQREYIRQRQAKCSGCKDGLNNQQGHMYDGGCLSESQ